MKWQSVLMRMFGRLFILFGLIKYCLARSDESCFDGPDFWCLNNTTESRCNFTDKTIGICGYSSKRCVVKTGAQFCKQAPPTQQSPLAFSGGLTGTDDNLFAYYILTLYWPPSSCPAKYNETLDFLRYFCSPYTDRDQPGSERLVLHGLWPTFSTKGNYQGWPQFCSATQTDWSQCHIDGNRCPWMNTTKEDFSQVDYEYCLAAENIQECLVNATAVLLPERERLKILAPGYLGSRNLFINHEWTKHGSCCSTIFGNNISNYLTHMLDLTDMATKPGSLTYEYIQRYAGEKIGLDYLIAALNQTAIINCNNRCELEEVSMCMDRDPQTGLPSRFIPCPIGARNNSDSCKKARCAYVFLPLRDQNRQTDDVYLSYSLDYPSVVCIVFLLSVLIFSIRKRDEERVSKCVV